MKIYIATRFANKDAARILALQLQEAGHTITSSWVFGSEDGMTRADIAVMDLADIDKAEALISITTGCELATGGMHFETGYAYASGKKVFYIGPKVNVFYNLPEVKEWEPTVATLVSTS